MKQVNYIFSKSELEEINRINKIMALRFKKDFDQISLQTFNDILTQNSPSFISENKVVFSCLNTKNLNYLQSLAEKTGIEHSYQYKDLEWELTPADCFHVYFSKSDTATHFLLNLLIIKINDSWLVAQKSEQCLNAKTFFNSQTWTSPL